MTRSIRVPLGLKRSEHDEQCALIEWSILATSQHPDLAMLFAIPNAGGFSGGFKANVARVAKLRREGVKGGVPDLMLATPRGRFHGLFLEMKRADGVPSDVSSEQDAWHMALLLEGYAVVAAFGFEQARKAILDYLAQ